MSLKMAQFGSLIWPTPSTERVLLLRAQPEAEELGRSRVTLTRFSVPLIPCTLQRRPPVIWQLTRPLVRSAN